MKRIFRNIWKGKTVYEKKPKKTYRKGNITLQSVINNPEGAVSLIKKYVKKEWYRGHKDTFWYNRHTSKFDIYSGYWSWESAAIVKRLGVDDTELKDIPYYPYDMVHGK